MALLEERYPAFKFEKVGDTFEGTILSVTELDDTDPATKQVKTWPNGNPKKCWVLAIEPAEGETRAVWVRGNLVTAMREAAREGGVKELEGAKIKVQHHELGKPTTAGFAPAKLFRVKLTPGTPKAALVDSWADDEAPF